MLYHRGAAGILYLSWGGGGGSDLAVSSKRPLMCASLKSVFGASSFCVCGDHTSGASVSTWRASIVTSCTVR